MHKLTALMLLVSGTLTLLPRFTEIPRHVHRHLQTWIGCAALAWGLWWLLRWLSHSVAVFQWPLWMFVSLLSALVLIALGLALAYPHLGVTKQTRQWLDEAYSKLGPEPHLVLGIAALILWLIRIIFW